MEVALMDAGIISGIVLTLVGILKLPFNKFKTNHPKSYRFTFYFLSLVLSVSLSVLAQLYVVCGTVMSTEFLMMTISTIAFVFGGYSTYENTALKNLVKKLVSSLKTLGDKHGESKAVKNVKKLVEKLGKEKIDEIIESL